MNSNAPWWGPGRPMVVADANKLSYFARANMVRAGVRGTYGALGGLSEIDVQGGKLVDTEEQGFQPVPFPVSTPAPPSPLSPPPMVTSDGQVLKPGGAGFIDTFVSSLSNLFKPAPPVQAPVVQQGMSTGTMVAIAGAAVVGGILLLKLVRS